VVLALFAVVQWQRAPGEAVHVVDYAAVQRGVAVSSAFPPVGPHGLSASWRATSAWYDTPAGGLLPGSAVWHVGFLTPSGSYAAFAQTDASVAVAVSGLASGSAATGSVVLGATRWQERTDPEGVRALVARFGPTTVVVSGKADEPELEILASSLR
jgi:hypothetical protein